MSVSPTKNVFIEFAGMPKSGKTTILDAISHYLRRRRINITEYHGGGRYAPVGKEDLGALNVYLACQTVQHILENSSSRRLPRLHLMDRGIVDRLIFTQALAKVSRVSLRHRSSIEGLLLCEEINPPDICFVFVTTPELSLARESVNKLIDSFGRVMNSELLEQLAQAARQLAEDRRVAHRAQQTVLVDTAEMNGLVRETAEKVLGYIVPVLEAAGISLVEEKMR
jgi:thymidylate kinase